MGWAYLVLAGMFEIGFSTLLKRSEGLTRLSPSVGFLLFAGVSFWFLAKAVTTIPLGTAYAVWSGIGAFGTAVIGIMFFGDPATLWRLFFLFTLAGSIIGLKLPISPRIRYYFSTSVK